MFPSILHPRKKGKKKKKKSREYIQPTFRLLKTHLPTPTGSSRGRGSRAASWLADYIDAQASEGAEEEAIKSYALEGGVRGWANAGPEYTSLMEGYDEGYWATG